LSDNEPRDPNRYFRLGDARSRRLENCIVIALGPEEREAASETAQRFRDKISRHVSGYASVIENYLRRRTREVMSERPERNTPRQVTLILRRYHINDPDQAPPFWSGPFSLPMARLQTGSSLEWYDPSCACFRSLEP
jgi:hypothetical protein